MARLAMPRGLRHGVILKPLCRLRTPSTTSSFSTTFRREAYEDTIPHLKIGSHTRVLYQGFTGRQATQNAKESIEYGTNIVGGVKPGVTGEHLGRPILPTVQEAVDKLKPDASAVYVPGDGCAKAIMDAIEAEIPLVVAVAEHVPIHDILRIHQMMNTTSKTRLVGANCPGIINTHGQCRLGFQPLPFFLQGNISIVAKSGTLSYETVASTTRAGLGQAYCISMGGDVIAGTTFVDALKIFEHDENTEGIIIVGEVGGMAEFDAAEWISNYRKREPNPKPIMAIVGGVEAPDGRIMGHAGAWAAPGEPSAKDKIKAFQDVDVTVVDHPEKFGNGMKDLLARRQLASKGQSFGTTQKRGLHTMRRRPRTTSSIKSLNQKRTLYIKQTDAFDMLKEMGISTSEQPPEKDSKQLLLAIAIDRTSRSPCIITSSSPDPSQAQRFPFPYGSDPTQCPKILSSISQTLDLGPSLPSPLTSLISNLTQIFMSREAFVIETQLSLSPTSSHPTIHSAHFGFDDAAFRSAGRQSPTHSLRDPSLEAWSDLEAEKFGMIYVQLHHTGPGTIGTIVNGAGLAMNTVDALISRGGSPANFCDTGGKATSETIKNAFRIVAADRRVKAIFVNIFGGLTRCDMIAEGIIKAFEDLGLTVPVVVRLRGTNEKEGQELIRRSGLKMDSFDGFEEAAGRVIGVAQGDEKI